MPALPPLPASEPETAPIDAEVLTREADAARDARDWVRAAARYGAVVALRPDDAGMWVQLGHAVKEGGDPAGARAAYERALTIDRGNADTHLQIGHVLKMQGRRDGAIAAYTQAARLNPAMAAARDELIALGVRDALPEESTRSTAMWRRLAAVGEALAEGRAAARDWIGGGAYPLAAYDRFRRDIPIRPPPGPLPEPGEDALIVLVDGGMAAPFLVRATLRSLQDQSVRQWRAVIVAPPETRAHPVASFAEVDTRITFVADNAIPDRAQYVVSVTAGTVLDPEALAWLVFAATRTGATIYADHDHGVTDAVDGLTRADPWLPGLLDANALVAGEGASIVIADASTLPREAMTGDALRRLLLTRAAEAGAIGHVARLLTTILDLPLTARGAAASDDDLAEGRLGPAPLPSVERARPARHDGRIAVVIPTRDAADLLARAITSLREKARDPARVEIIVVDNRSVAPDTAALLNELDRAGTVRVVAMDTAFNWSRASNLGAAASDAATVVFANNDLEMLTSGWDDLVLGALAADGVGAVGIRLLYPDMTVQHAGMVFGMGTGRVEHEGRGAAFDDAGPGRRLVTTRSVAAVTGAFLAIARDRFDAIGGFDAGRLFVGHSDVDLCLRVRECGSRVVYLAEVEAIHHESKTRGRDDGKAAVAWDEAERADLIERWGASLDEDPGVNPYWTPRGVPFDGLYEPSLRAVVRHLDVSARARPWRPTRRAAQEEGFWRPDAF